MRDPTRQREHPEIPSRPSFSFRKNDASTALQHSRTSALLSSAQLPRRSDAPNKDGEGAKGCHQDRWREGVGRKVRDCAWMRISKWPRPKVRERLRLLSPTTTAR